MTTHDVTLCKKYCNKMLLMKSTGNNIFGQTKDVYNNETLSKIFNLDVYKFLGENKYSFCMLHLSKVFNVFLDKYCIMSFFIEGYYV